MSHFAPAHLFNQKTYQFHEQPAKPNIFYQSYRITDSYIHTLRRLHGERTRASQEKLTTETDCDAANSQDTHREQPLDFSSAPAGGHRYLQK
jgi:hypothetical protein